MFSRHLTIDCSGKVQVMLFPCSASLSVEFYLILYDVHRVTKSRGNPNAQIQRTSFSVDSEYVRQIEQEGRNTAWKLA
ncbi:hypothetical protein GCM10008968_04500 [Bacillus horti]